MRRRLLVLSVTLVVVVGLVAPASAAGQPRYEIDREALAALLEEIDEEDATTYDGERGGAAWVVQVPDDWNGDLVVWAHGYRGEGTSLTVDAPPAREWLLDHGYAWAASSYRRNSYDAGIGVVDTALVTLQARRILGRIGETYLVGVSMGGHVTAASIERIPRLYDGALPACGALGDVELFDFFLDYNVGAAALAGLEPDQFEFPADDWTSTTVRDIRNELAVGGVLSSGALGGPDLLKPAGDRFKDFVEVGTGGERGAIYDAAWDYWHVGADPSGNFFFSLGEGDLTIANRPGTVSQNTDTDYSTEYGFDIDDDVVRVERARRYEVGGRLGPAPVVRGTPSVPVLTMHTIGDLFVPVEMEQIYAREVAANGRSHLLVQRLVRDVGHCTFTELEWIDAYTALFDWVEDGVRPEGDDVFDLDGPLVGCQFTRFDTPPPAALRVFPCP